MEHAILLGLRRIRNLRRLVIAVFLLIVPASYIAGRICEAWGILAFCLAMFAYAVVALHFIATRCPACGKHWSRKWYWHNAFARHCVHCGLEMNPDTATVERAPNHG